jgi:hypothetical protein
LERRSPVRGPWQRICAASGPRIPNGRGGHPGLARNIHSNSLELRGLAGFGGRRPYCWTHHPDGGNHYLSSADDRDERDPHNRFGRQHEIAGKAAEAPIRTNEELQRVNEEQGPLRTIASYSQLLIRRFEGQLTNETSERSATSDEVRNRCATVRGFVGLYRGGHEPEGAGRSRRSERRFAVANNGIGISPDYHSQIFGVLKRLHGKSIPGTGIGLAICQRVVERYGGRIWVESQVGEGASFTSRCRPGGG